ncbi:ionic transporter y4hA [Methylopila jiangsuensis]|uniref:Ionic transporter y4hA n=1 Tax=Methylopila jiangsuensis TaxID=586230 RepID=A0A9W6N4G2_9HYPH|nr:ionic transporter y4hA [Methylopila jiangsuensis]MDR6286518.1 Ca2+:H+ antiporter [Methylopila jiangsuensis]GLK77142.1 ionic transporter y4hA [Methylopila jiangsuensis]
MSATLVDPKPPISTWAFPVAGVAFYVVLKLLGLTDGYDGSALGLAASVALVPVLFGAVFAAVHHAEVIAHRTGEPYGTLVLTMAVTIMEVAVLSSDMLGDNPNPVLARDTIMAVLMIVVNGLVGLCILFGGLRHKEQNFRVTGANAYLAVLIPLAALSLVLPNHTVAVAGNAYSISQLAFVAVATLAIYAAFLYTQTVRNREYFAVVIEGDEVADKAHKPSNRSVAFSFAFLILALAVVILLAKTFTSVVAFGLDRVSAPPAVAGVIVALLILMPEFAAAIRAARADKIQKSINLALGSACATIGLTIPAIAAISIVFGAPLQLGLDSKDTVLLLVTVAVSLLTFGTGRTNILYGLIHLVLFATFMFLVIVP